MKKFTQILVVAAMVGMLGIHTGVASANSGTGWQSPSSTPVPSRGATAVVAAGSDDYFYDKSTGYVFGNSVTGEQKVPVAAANGGSLAGKSVVAIEADDIHQCALASDGSLHCWGAYENPTARGYDLFLLGAGVASKEPRQIFASGVTSFGVSGDSACAVVNGGALCWGDPRSVTGSNATKPASTQPTAPVGLPPVVSISLDTGKACAVDTTGGVWCWGSSGLELGINATASTPYPPTKLAGSLAGKIVVQVSTASDNSCALDSMGGVHCWGADKAYAGVGGQGKLPEPAQVAGSLAGKYIVQVSASDQHAFALDSNGGIHEWALYEVPKLMTKLGSLAGRRAVQLRADEKQICAIDVFGTAHCWGSNAEGQLGIGSTTLQYEPVAVTSGAVAKKTVVSVTPHDGVTFFIVADPVMSFPAGVKDSGNVTLDLTQWSAGLAKGGASLGASGKAKAKGTKITMPIVRAGKTHMLLDGNIEITAANGSKAVFGAPIIELASGQVTAVAYGVKAPHTGNRVALLTVDPKVKKQKSSVKSTKTQVVTTKITKGLPVAAALAPQVAFPGDALFPGETHSPGSPAGTFSSTWKATKSLKKK